MNSRALLISGVVLIVTLIFMAQFFFHGRSLPLDKLRSETIELQIDGKKSDMTVSQKEALGKWLVENDNNWMLDYSSYADTDFVVRGKNYKIIFLHDGSVVFQGYEMGWFESALIRKESDFKTLKNLLERVVMPEHN